MSVERNVALVVASIFSPSSKSIGLSPRLILLERISVDE